MPNSEHQPHYRKAGHQPLGRGGADSAHPWKGKLCFKPENGKTDQLSL